MSSTSVVNWAGGIQRLLTDYLFPGASTRPGDVDTRSKGSTDTQTTALRSRESLVLEAARLRSSLTPNGEGEGPKSRTIIGRSGDRVTLLPPKTVRGQQTPEMELTVDSTTHWELEEGRATRQRR